MPNLPTLVPYPVYSVWAFAHQLFRVVLIIQIYEFNHPQIRQHTTYMMRVIERLLQYLENRRLVATEWLNPFGLNIHQQMVQIPLLQYVYFTIATEALSRSIRTLRRLMRRQHNRRIRSFLIMYI